MSRLMACAVLAGSSLSLSACAGGPSLSEAMGECADAYGADVCTWATMEADQIVSVGATIPLASIEGAPGEIPMTWPPAVTAALDLPEAAQAAGVTHLTMYWEPMGHTPETFMTPHFDFHFYLVPESLRVAIDCEDESKPATLPAGYGLVDEVLPPELVDLTGEEVLVGVCVPEMGMHSLHMVEVETTEPFDGTMVVGYYEGEPIFVEPMISRAYLMRRQSFDMEIPAVTGSSGMPSTFEAVYDGNSDAYRFTLSGFGHAE